MKNDLHFSLDSYYYIDQDSFLHKISNVAIKREEVYKHIRDIRKSINLHRDIDFYHCHLNPLFYPNMKSKSSVPNEIYKMKKQIAEFHGDFRCLWFLNNRHRDVFHDHKIMNWKQYTLTPLDFHRLASIGSSDQSILYQMQWINQETRINTSRPVILIPKDLHKKYPLFKTVTDLFIDIEYDIDGNVYLIGMWTKDIGYSSFWSTEKKGGEKEMWLDFIQTLNSFPCYRICYWYIEKQKIMERFDLFDIPIPEIWKREKP
jgi:hypothetical protein